MTSEELDQRFPNGLVDAEITGLAVDYSNRSAMLRMKLRCSPPDSSDRDVYTPAVLTVREIFYLSIEPPDLERLFSAKRSTITVDGLPENPEEFLLLGHLKSRLPAGAFCCRFYVHDWNSFIHLAAGSADFSAVQPRLVRAGAFTAP
jgi:hypothetical protein